MRILFLTARLPYPPDRGDRLRAYHFLEQLSSEHEVTLVSFAARDPGDGLLAPLRRFCRDMQIVPMSSQRSIAAAAVNAWRREPLQALYYHSPAMRQRVARVVERAEGEGRPFQVGVAHLFRMAPYLGRRTSTYRIVDLTDVISLEVERSLPYRSLAWRLIYSLEGPRIRRYERWAANAFDEAWLISEADRRALAAQCGGANLRVVPNGVDSACFYPSEGNVRPDSLLFVGHMGVQHNVDAATFLARDIFPSVREQVPSSTLEIAGASPARQVQSLSRFPSVRVAGFVPDLNRRLNEAAVFVAPLRFGAGVQNKVLEAMAAARPVVTTSLVNEGLGAQPGRDLLLADGAEQLAAQIVTLLRDPALRRRIGEAGLDFVRRSFAWDQVGLRMRQIEAALKGE